MKEINQKDVGKRIKSEREKLNMSQFGLYEKTGISTTQISAYENGRKSLGLQSLSKIAFALGLSMDELYYGSENARPITMSVNRGELIVNCIYALYEQGVVCMKTRTIGDEYGCPSKVAYDKAEFDGFSNIIDDLIEKLEDLQHSMDDYPEPEAFKNQLLAAAAKRINRQIQFLTKKQRL